MRLGAWLVFAAFMLMSQCGNPAIFRRNASASAGKYAKLNYPFRII